MFPPGILASSGYKLKIENGLGKRVFANERPEKEADSSRLVGGEFTEQGNLHRRPVLGSHEMSKSLHPPLRILKYGGLNWVQ